MEWPQFVRKDRPETFMMSGVALTSFRNNNEIQEHPTRFADFTHDDFLSLLAGPIVRPPQCPLFRDFFPTVIKSIIVDNYRKSFGRAITHVTLEFLL